MKPETKKQLIAGIIATILAIIAALTGIELDQQQITDTAIGVVESFDSATTAPTE